MASMTKDTHTDNEDRLDKILKQYSTDVQRGMAEIGLSVAKGAIQSNYTPKVADKNVGDPPPTPQATVQGDEPAMDSFKHVQRLVKDGAIGDNAAAFAVAIGAKPGSTKSSGELEEIANTMMRDLFERHDVFAKGWHEPVYGKRIHIGDDCPKCGTNFAGLRDDIRSGFMYYAEQFAATQTTKLQAEARLDEVKRLQSIEGSIDPPSERNWAMYQYHFEDRIAQLEREYKIGEDGE